jgi:hypothetical protein
MSSLLTFLGATPSFWRQNILILLVVIYFVLIKLTGDVQNSLNMCVFHIVLDCDGLTTLMSKPTIRHDPEIVPSTTHPQNLFP